MAGLYPPDHGVGINLPYGYPPPFALQARVPYPRRKRWPLAVVITLVIAVIGGAATAIVFANRHEDAVRSGSISDSAARTAIQSYLDAMTSGDNEAVARHTLCGLFEAVKDRRSDLAVAKLNSDAFRKQFRKADVRSIDKIVPWSPTQAQVLFTMHVVRTSARGQGPTEDQQAVAQLLAHDNEVLVCSYLPRAAGQY
jgi:hypothetical protein